MWNKITSVFRKFSVGRYGFDALYCVLSISGMLLWIIGQLTVRLGWLLVGFGLMVWAFYRMLSRDIPQRQKENAALLAFWKICKAWLQLQRDRIHDFPTTVYAPCPQCRAILRLPRKKGKHTAVCPRCRNRLEVRVFFGKFGK